MKNTVPTYLQESVEMLTAFRRSLTESAIAKEERRAPSSSFQALIAADDAASSRLREIEAKRHFIEREMRLAGLKFVDQQ